MHLAALLQLVIAASALLSAALLLLRFAASRFFAPFDHDDASMSIGAPDPCAACGDASRHKCSRCKRARYCSQACQSKHWNSHKLNCKTSTLLDDKAGTVSSDNGVRRRRKSSGFGSISLVPARGTCKVLREPKKILFPYEEFVRLFNWDKPGFYPCGLLNCGNSCFANVVLQCLSSTRPLLAYLLERDHSRGCIRKRDDWCFLCELQAHVQRASESLYPFSPINILSRLPNIGGTLGCGRQEDAHEFMRFAIDTMQSVCLDEFGGEKAVELSSQETTLIQYIFGGHLQSQVICTKCNMVSNRYENMMDLTVEIQGDAESLEECLEQFTMKEWLDGENMYKCDGCNDYVKAWKQLTIHQAPNILTIALKRFQSGRFGKLNKRITFPENLDLTPYMSGNSDDCNLYTLYAVVVHVDMLNASFFGHYICYTKDYHGRWYRIDDSKVMHVEVEEVLAQGAYMLFYSRRAARREAFIKPVKPAKKNVLALAPDTSEPRPIGMPQFRDTGHERNFSVESSSLNEKISDHMDLEIVDETTPVSVTKGSMDMDMDDSHKSSTANVPVGTSPVKPMQSNSTLPAEISFAECQLMDCEESCSSANQSFTTSSLSSSVLEPCDSSKADVSMKLDLGEICTAEEAPNLLKCMPIDSSSKNCVKTSSTVSVTASSVSQNPDNSSHNLEQVVAASSPSFSANGLNALDDVSGYKGTNSLAFCRKNNFSRQSKPLFSRGFLDRSMRKGSAGQGNGFNHPSKINGYINGHMEIDNGKQNLHSDGVRLEPNSVNGQHIPAGLDVSLVSSSSENKADYEMMNVGKNVNTNCDGSTEVDSRQVDSRNDSKPELVPNSDGSTEVGLRQVVSGNGSGDCEDTRKMHQLSTNRNTTGKLGADQSCYDASCELNTAIQNVSCNGASLNSHRTNGKAILQPSGLTAGFLNKGYRTSGEKKIARKEQDETDSCSKVNRNEFSGLQSSERPPNGSGDCEDTRKMHQLSTNRNTTGKLDLDSADQSCYDASCEPNTAIQNVSRNGASLNSLRTNGKAILQPSGLTAGFLNKGYRTSGEKKIARKEPDETDNCSKVNCNEFSGLQSSERPPDSASLGVHSNPKRVHSKSAAPYMSPGFLNKPYRRPMKVGKTDHTCNGSTEPVSICQNNNEHSKSAAPYMSPGFLNKPSRRPMKVGKTDHTCNGSSEPASICQNSNEYYKPVVTLAEMNDDHPVPVPAPLGNGNNSVPLVNDLGLEVDSDVGSLDRSETSPAMQLKRELVRSLSTLKEHCD